jgi:hypothetical protein
VSNKLYFNSLGYSGRLGNQMFQFASAFAISSNNGLELKIPFQNTRTPKMVKLTNSQIVEYKLELFDCFDLPKNFLINESEIKIKNTKRELNFGYSHDFLSLRPNTNIDGYFQDYRYFLNFRHQITELFNFNEKVRSLANQEYEEIQKFYGQSEVFNMVAVHIRRGDYLTGDGRHYSVDVTKYLALLNEVVKNKKIVIFSDDINYINSIVKFQDCYKVDIGNHFAEMCLMSMFKNLIISNSTFSWWAAYLSVNPQNIFIPKPWFGPKLNHFDTTGLYVENWKTF